MPYVNRTTFEISRLNKSSDNDYFYVDELIAHSIRSLNKKGYFTHFSCEGHHYQPKRFLEIVFWDEVDLPSLPEGYANTQCRLKYEYTSEDIFKFAHEKADICMRLYVWAESLPKNPFYYL